MLYPPCAARFLLERARQHGAEIRTGAVVQELLPEGGVRLADGARISPPDFVNATGPWSPTLTPGLPVRRRKGHLVITDRYPGFVRHQIVELGYLKSAHAASSDSVAFNIQPRQTGQMLIGSSRQFDAESAAVDQGILDRMLWRALEYLPELGKLSALRVWTGHRAATPDKLPLIGPSGRRPDLAGHRARGPGHHHVAGHRATAGGPTAQPAVGNLRHALCARAVRPGRPAWLSRCGFR